MGPAPWNPHSRGSRADIASADTVAAFDGLTFSAITGDGLPHLVGAMAGVVHTARDAEPAPEPFVVQQPHHDALARVALLVEQLLAELVTDRGDQRRSWFGRRR